jgi:hypothetical protein
MANTTEKLREGEAILWTLLILAALARVEQADLLAAAALWARSAPAAAQGLVYAGEPRSRYTWDQRRLRYVRPDGVTVKPSAVKQAVNSFVEDAGDELADVTRQMNAGEITIQEWQTRMAQQVKSTHLAVEIVAQGGVSQMTPQDMTRASKGIDFQLRRLLEFSKEVSRIDPNTGTLEELETPRVTVPAVSDEKAIARAKLYAATARSTYEESVLQSWLDLAATGVAVEMKNVLHEPHEHCYTSEKKKTIGCVEETRRGWVKLGTMSLPGRRTCQMNCFCHVEYRRKPPQNAQSN